ncbi:MAG: MFS transporter [Salinisphaeraceae bacterium]
MIAGRLLPIRAGEAPAAAWSFIYFFCVLAAYYLLRPVRDALAISDGTGDLPWLFTGTFLAMLLAVPAFAWLAARYPRRLLLPLVYGFFILDLLLFWGWLASGRGEAIAAGAFFIWLSVFNLFVVSVFWSFMADIFSAAQGKRLFALIAAGGSAGAISGPGLAALLAGQLGVLGLLPLSAGLLTVALGCIVVLRRWAADQIEADRSRLGGGVWEGVRRITESRYLQGVALFILCYTALSTVLYFQQAELVSRLFDDDARRTQLFAAVDLATNVVTVGLQLFVTHHLIRRLGLGAALGSLPAISLLGFLVLGLVPVIAVLVVFQVLRRSANYAVARPAREALFTVLPRTDKYKAKNAIDTLVYRGGDALSGWAYTGLTGLGLGLTGMAFAVLPIATGWLLLSAWLGRAHTRRYHDVASESFAHGEPP